MTDNALHNIAESFVGRPIGREMTDEEVAKSAVMLILKYYHIKLPDAQIPNDIGSIQGLLDYCVHKCGLVYREVSLDTEWYKKASGIMIGRQKKDGTSVVLLPGKLKGYRSLNLKTGSYTKMDRNSVADIDPEAVCFYLPFPGTSMTISGLFRYMIRQLNTADIIFFFLLAAAAALMYAMIPIIMTWTWQYCYEAGLSKPLLISICGIVGFAVCLTGILFCTYQLKLRIGVKVNINTEAAWMQKLLHMPPAFYRKFSPSELAVRAIAARSVSGLLVESAFLLITVSLNILGLLILIGQTQNETVFSYIAVSILIQLIFHTLFIIGRNRVVRKQTEKAARADGMFYQMINEMKRIRLSGAEAAYFAQWAGRYAEYAEHKYHPPIFFAAYETINLVITLLVEILLYLLLPGQGIKPHVLMLIVLCIWLTDVFFEKIVHSYSAISEISVCFKFAEPIMRSEQDDNTSKVVMKHFYGSIEIKNLSYRYDTKRPFVLSDLSMDIAPGEFVAIVGETGCGKSTLIRLMMGMEAPEQGMVVVDYRNISEYDPSSLHSHFGLVTKNDRLFPGTLMYNILMNALDQTEETAWKAAEAACVADDIRNMPMGMKTSILENEARFSSGQIQRILIARALASKPEVVILDDATGALDNITLKRLYKSLETLKCTRIVVSHSPAAVKYADRIICIDKGTVVEQGTYDELAGRNGFFTALMEEKA